MKGVRNYFGKTSLRAICRCKFYYGNKKVFLILRVEKQIVFLTMKLSKSYMNFTKKT